MNFIYDLLDKLRQFIYDNLWFAPLSAVLLPFLEALIPSLPLTILVSFNLSIMATAFGVVKGTFLTIFLSTFGSLAGMILIFFIIRVTLAPRFVKKVQDHKLGKKFLNMVNGPNTFLVLILLSNPFLPSSILNYALSLTKIKFPKYLMLTGISRLIIMLFLVFLGSLFNIQENPLNLLWVLLLYFSLLGIWLIWSKLSQKKEVEEETQKNI